jgi:hypothetical protein
MMKLNEKDLEELSLKEKRHDTEQFGEVDRGKCHRDINDINR